MAFCGARWQKRLQIENYSIMTCAPLEAKLRRRIEVFLLCPQCEIIEGKQVYSSTKVELESFRTITCRFLLLN